MAEAVSTMPTFRIKEKDPRESHLLDPLQSCGFLSSSHVCVLSHVAPPSTPAGVMHTLGRECYTTFLKDWSLPFPSELRNGLNSFVADVDRSQLLRS